MDSNNNNNSNNNSFMPTPTPTPPSSDIVGGWDALLSDLPGSESFASDTADAAPSQIIPSQQTQQPTLQQPQDNNNNHNNDDLQDLTSDPTLSDLLRDDSFPVNLNPTSSQGPTSPLPQQQQQQQHQDTTDVSSSTVSSSSSSSYHNTKSPFFAVSPHHHYRHHHHNNNTTNNNPSVSTATEASQYDDNDNDNYRAMDDDDDLQHARSSSNDHQNIINNNNNNTTPQKKKYRLQLPETLMVRTRSRAHVDAASSPRSPASKHSTASASASATTSHQEPLHMIRIYEDEEVMHYHTRLVKKRVRVVQLLVFGLMGLVLGFFGGLFVQGSCHFATARMIVGQSEQPFTSSYGLWKYRPIDNVFQGQSYCLNYGRYSDETPHVARIAGVLAVMAGTYSMAVLWTYLISGRASHQYWKWAVRAAVVSGVLQALTLVFFVSGVCLNESCTPGPGAIVSIVSTIAWFVLGYELHYNRPINEHLPELQPASTDDSAFVKNLEMADFQQGANDYLMRMHGGAITPRYQPPGAMSSLNGAQRANDQPLGQLLSEVRSPVASVTGAQRFPSP